MTKINLEIISGKYSKILYKNSFTRVIANNKASETIWNLNPEQWWGAPLVQEEKF
jgi:hypothetical protein